MRIRKKLFRNKHIAYFCLLIILVFVEACGLIKIEVSINEDNSEGISIEEKESIRSFQTLEKGLPNSVVSPAFSAGETTIYEVTPEQVKSLTTSFKYVVVDLWATFCGPCIDKMDEISSLANSCNSDSTAILLVCNDYEIEKIKNIYKKKNIKGPAFILRSPEGTTKLNKKIQEYVSATCDTCTTFLYGYPTYQLFINGELKIIGGHEIYPNIVATLPCSKNF